MDKISTAVINLAEKHFEDFKVRNGQVIPRYCPFCQREQPQRPFIIRWEMLLEKYKRTCVYTLK